MAAAPVVIMLAGPNGAGKSSIAPGLLAKALRVVEFVNADTIARGISGFNWESAAVAAGRIMLARLDELAKDRLSFAFETTGASRSFVDRINALREGGYEFFLSYIWVESPEICIERVAQRVQLGGHGIPPDTVRRRYWRSLCNFFDLYQPLAQQWQFYDNTSPGDGIMLAEGGRDCATQVYGAASL